MDGVLGQPHVVRYLRDHITAPQHMMFFGPSGVGKSMTARGFFTEYLTAAGVPAEEQATYVMECRSVDDRGIATVRGKLAEFAHRVRRHRGVCAWVWFDDADSVPLVSQQALRRVLETCELHVRFVFCAAGPETFIEPLQSRCVVLQFLPVDITAHGGALCAAHAPELRLDTSAERWLYTMSLGNVRLFVRYLQMLRAAGAGAVDAALAQTVVNAPPVRKLRSLAEASLARDRLGVTAVLLDLWSTGYSFEDVVALLEVVCRTYSFFTPEETQRLYLACGEGHVAMIANRTRLLDAVALFAGEGGAAPV